MEIFFSETPLRINEEEWQQKEKIFEYLKNRGCIGLDNNYVVFRNFTGIIELNKTEYLIIPRKLALHLGLVNENNTPDIDFKEKFHRLFKNFLTYIIKELTKEGIIFDLTLAHFPVKESKLNNSKTFKLLLLLEKKEELINSLYLILSNPNRNLIEYETYKTIDEVTYVDANIVADIVQNPERMHKTENGIIQYESKSYTPTAVLQYESEETFDTLENRFIKHFLKELDFILTNDLKEFMFIEELKQIKNEVEYALQSDVFTEVGELSYFPSNSQVLMKRAGYKEIFQIYRLLHISFIPKIFEDLDMAFSLKDMATLWEYYVLIKLLKELKEEFGDYKVEIDFEERSKYKYEEAKFRFSNGLVIHYQKTKNGYSCIKLRPDFLIEYNNIIYIFDAKFRLFKHKNNREDILKNMHYYKDGLGSKAAVAICLGKENKKGCFWKVDGSSICIDSFVKILEIKDLKGVGYIDLRIDLEE